MKRLTRPIAGILPALLTLFGLAFALACSAQSGSQALIKKRAKDLNRQNNARQGVTPSQPSQPRPAAPAASRPSYQYSAQPAVPALPPQVAKLRDQLALLEKAKAADENQKRQLNEDLMAAAQGSPKPSEAKLSKLASDLFTALAGKSLTPNQQTILAQQLHTGLNTKLNARQMEKLAGEVQDGLKSVGAGRVYSAVVANDLKSIIADIQAGS